MKILLTFCFLLGASTFIGAWFLGFSTVSTIAAGVMVVAGLTSILLPE